MNDLQNEIEYDVAFSFAGAQREYVEKVKDELSKYGVSIFYDNDNSVKLWGKDLYRYLNSIYSTKSRFCVMFISKEYAESPWTKHESQAAQERIFNSYDEQDFQEYILPVIFDDTKIPGIRETTGYLDAKKYSPEEIAKFIAQKVNASKAVEKSPYTALSLFEQLKTKLYTYNKTNPDIKMIESKDTFSIISLKHINILTIQLIENQIYIYINEYSLGENPCAIMFIDDKQRQEPIKIINFSVYFGQSPELNLTFNKMNLLLEEILTCVPEEIE